MARYATIACTFDATEYGRPIKSSYTRYEGDDFGEALKEANYRGQCLEENGYEAIQPSDINEGFADGGQFPYQTYYADADCRIVTLVYVRDFTR